MANYRVERRLGKGGVRFRALVRWRENRKPRSVSKTFSSHRAADEWGNRQVERLENNDLVQGGRHTVGDLIRRYLEEPLVQVARTRRYSLNLIADCDIASIDITDLSTQDLIAFASDRKDAGTGPVTVAIDIYNLKSVFRDANLLWGVPAPSAVVEDAIPILYRFGLMGKSKARSRRLEEGEFEKMTAGLLERQNKNQSHIPFVDLFEFSILSCMRVSEVCSIRWEDLDRKKKKVMVRNRKDPRKKQGNHMWVRLLGGAFEIIERQEKSDERIFPYDPRSVTAGWQRVRAKLGIQDLRYHDLRREGASRLFEKGYTITEVAQVTGHRDINLLWRVYTELFPENLQER